MKTQRHSNKRTSFLMRKGKRYSNIYWCKFCSFIYYSNTICTKYISSILKSVTKCHFTLFLSATQTIKTPYTTFQKGH